MSVETPDPEQMFQSFMVGAAKQSLTRADFKRELLAAGRVIKLAIDAMWRKVDAKLATIKDGAQGPKGDKGDSITGPRGPKGDKGDSITGPPGPPGTSVLEEALAARLSGEIVPQISAQVEKQLPALGAMMRDGLELLQGDERLDAEAIRNLEEYLKKYLKPHLDTALKEYGMGGGWGVVGVQGIHVGTGLAIDNSNLQFPTITLTAGASSFLSETVSGTINGSNTIFTVPTTIVTAMVLYLAGIPYQLGVDYTVTGAKQITMTIAPDASLSGQPFWLLHT